MMDLDIVEESMLDESCTNSDEEQKVNCSPSYPREKFNSPRNAKKRSFETSKIYHNPINDIIEKLRQSQSSEAVVPPSLLPWIELQQKKKMV